MLYPVVNYLSGLRGAFLRDTGISKDKVGLLTGRTPRNVREPESKKPYLFATQHFAIASEGFDKPEVDSVVVGGLCLGPRQFFQILGRAGRGYPGKESARVAFIVEAIDVVEMLAQRRAEEAREKGIEVVWVDHRS